MHARLLPFMLLAALAGFAGMATLPARTAAQDQSNPADAAPAPFTPNMGDMMSILIQPRHAKLALAGKAENWVLAGYVLKELQQGFGTITKVIPRWKALPVSELVDAALKQPFAAMDLVIKAGDTRQFGKPSTRSRPAATPATPPPSRTSWSSRPPTPRPSPTRISSPGGIERLPKAVRPPRPHSTFRPISRITLPYLS